MQCIGCAKAEQIYLGKKQQDDLKWQQNYVETFWLLSYVNSLNLLYENALIILK